MNLLKKHRLEVLLTITFTIRLIYVFLLTEYSHYLVSDMGAFWARALAHLHGDTSSPSQWMLQAPFFHVMLAGYLHLIDLAGLSGYRLEETLLLNAALGTAGVWFFYRTMLTAFEQKNIAFVAAVLYAFTFPLVYMNAFVMTENFSLPLLLAANYFLFTASGKTVRVAAAGVLLALAAGMRPCFAAFALPFAAFAFFDTHPGQRRAFATTAFVLAFALTLSLIALENSRLSYGKMKGLSAHAGLNFYLGKTKPGMLFLVSPEGNIGVGPSEYVRQQRPQIRLESTTHDEAFFYKKGWEEIRKRPALWFENFLDLRYFLTGAFFPRFDNAFQAPRLLRLFYAVFAGMTVPALILTPFFAWRDLKRRRWLFFWSLFAVVAAEGYIFLPDARYFLPLVGPLYALFLWLAARAAGLGK